MIALIWVYFTLFCSIGISPEYIITKEGLNLLVHRQKEMHLNEKGFESTMFTANWVKRRT